MNSSEQLAQALIQFLVFFAPGFVVFLVVDWALGFFRADS